MATAHIAAASANSLRWITLVALAGDGGTLTGLGVAGGPDYHYMRVSLDGAVVANDFLAGTGSTNHVNNGIGVSLPFATDLRVDIRDEPMPSSITNFWVAYVTDNSEPISESTRVETIDGKQYRYRTVRFAKEKDGTYEVDTLLGPRFVAQVKLDRDVVVLDRYPGRYLEEFPFPEPSPLTVTAYASVLDRETGENVPYETLGAAIRLSGRSMTIVETSFHEGPNNIPIWLPAGEYSIATTQPEFANVPAYFTVL